MMHGQTQIKFSCKHYATRGQPIAVFLNPLAPEFPFKF